MIGLLRKDIYMLYGAYKKNILLLFLMYTMVIVTMKNTFLLGLAIWLMSFYSLSAITMDDSCGWGRYARTLPVSDGVVIMARFLSTLVMLCAGVAFAVTIAVVLCCFMHYAVFSELMTMIALVTAVALATLGLLLPAAYKWGVEKARNTSLALFMLACMIPLMLKKLAGRHFTADLLEIRIQELSLGWLSVWAMGIGLLIFFFGSWLSSRIYAKKEF